MKQNPFPPFDYLWMNEVRCKEKRGLVRDGAILAFLLVVFMTAMACSASHPPFTSGSGHGWLSN